MRTRCVPAHPVKLVELMHNSQSMADDDEMGWKPRGRPASKRPLGPEASSSFHSFVPREPLRASRSQNSSSAGSMRPSPVQSRAHSSASYMDEDTEALEGTSAQRREIVRRQRIDAEQRRRTELRDAYLRLKDVLPAGGVKMSKLVILSEGLSSFILSVFFADLRARILATGRIHTLEEQNKEDAARLAQIEENLTLERALNERLLLAAAAGSSGTEQSSSG